MTERTIPARAPSDRLAPSAPSSVLALAVIVTCQLMVVLDATVVNIALPTFVK